MREDRLNREREFHDERFGGDDGARRSAEKYYLLMEHVTEKYRELVRKVCDKRELLEYGCGTG